MASETTRYVLFDLETRDINGIVRNKPGIGETYFEVDFENVREFFEGKKNTANYYVEKDSNQSVYNIKLKQNNIAIHLLDDRLYRIPKKTSADITVTNDKENRIFSIKMDSAFQEYMKSKYKINTKEDLENVHINGVAVLDFIFCYDNDPHNLISFNRIPVLQLLLEEKVDISYQKSYNNYSVYTKRIYNDYAYKEI